MEEDFDSVSPRRKARRLLVLDEIVGQMFDEAVDISGVDRVEHASRRRGVIH